MMNAFSLVPLFFTPHMVASQHMLYVNTHTEMQELVDVCLNPGYNRWRQSSVRTEPQKAKVY